MVIRPVGEKDAEEKAGRCGGQIERDRRAERRDSRQIIRNVAKDNLDDMVGCGMRRSRGGGENSRESSAVGIVSSAPGEIRTGNTHPPNKQVPRINVQKTAVRGKDVESWRTAVIDFFGGGEGEGLGCF